MKRVSVIRAGRGNGGVGVNVRQLSVCYRVFFVTVITAVFCIAVNRASAFNRFYNAPGVTERINSRCIRMAAIFTGVNGITCFGTGCINGFRLIIVTVCHNQRVSVRVMATNTYVQIVRILCTAAFNVLRNVSVRVKSTSFGGS